MTEETRALVTVDPGLDTLTLAKLLAQSGYFADARDQAQALVKMLAGRELGFGPIASMTGINIIKGKVTLSANLMAAAVKRSGAYNYRIRRLDNQAAEIEFFENGKTVGVSTFTSEDAHRAGLVGGNHQAYPRNMLFARAMSNGARWYCPDIWGGPVYTPEELADGTDVVDAPAVKVVPPDPSRTPEPTVAPTGNAWHTKLAAVSTLPDLAIVWRDITAAKAAIGAALYAELGQAKDARKAELAEAEPQPVPVPAEPAAQTEEAF